MSISVKIEMYFEINSVFFISEKENLTNKKFVNHLMKLS